MEKTDKLSHKIILLFKDYFLHSDEKLKAWLLLAGTVACTIALVGLTLGFAWWSGAFWVALTAKTLTPFLISLAQFAILAAAYVGTTILNNLMMGKLSIRWRDWLTRKTLSELFHGKNNYLELVRQKKITHIGQRIQEDIQNMVTLTLSLGVNILKSILSLTAFTATLWVVGGAITIGANLVIPGYLVWVALAAALVATIITHAIGKSLGKHTKASESAEADFRKTLLETNQQAENIAEEHAEHYYKNTATKNLDKIKDASSKKLNKQTEILAFQSFYNQAASLIPLVCAAPLYFSGLIQISQLMQICIAFEEVNTALNVFASSYNSIATWRANMERFSQLKESIMEDSPLSSTKGINQKLRKKPSIKLKGSKGEKNSKGEKAGITIYEPRKNDDEKDARICSLSKNITFHKGENVLIQGPSGTGKSTLFKVLSGTWKYGKGRVFLPKAETETETETKTKSETIYFLPQIPTIPDGTLKAVLAYPDVDVEKYTDEQYKEALRLVGGLDKFVKNYDKYSQINDEWRNILSPGQKQRIAFARVLLKKPDWLFLDEATSSLDLKSEEHVYKLLKEELPGTTIISIGHRDTIRHHHHKVIEMKKTKTKTKTNDVMVDVEEKWIHQKARQKFYPVRPEEAAKRPSRGVGLI